MDQQLQKPALMAHSTSLRHPPQPQDNPGGGFNLRDWDLKASRITRQTTNSRRFSASYITEDACRSFRSNITTAISSTASSPGYPQKEQIDPSTYSFTAALKGLQAKSAIHNNWDCLSPEGFALNSKWSDAEKYISNPLSGQVPVECLSARSLQKNRVTISLSAPLVYSANAKTRTAQLRPSLAARKGLFQIPIEEKEVVGMTKDAGIQSIKDEITNDSSSSPSPSPTSTPSIGERMSKRLGMEAEESPNSSSKRNSTELEVEVEIEKGGGAEETEEDCKQMSSEILRDDEMNNGCEQERTKQAPNNWCFSWIVRWTMQHKLKVRPQTPTPTPPRSRINKNTLFVCCSCTSSAVN